MGLFLRRVFPVFFVNCTQFSQSSKASAFLIAFFKDYYFFTVRLLWNWTNLCRCRFAHGTFVFFDQHPVRLTSAQVDTEQFEFFYDTVSCFVLCRMETNVKILLVTFDFIFTPWAWTFFHKSFSNGQLKSTLFFCSFFHFCYS